MRVSIRIPLKATELAYNRLFRIIPNILLPVRNLTKRMKIQDRLGSSGFNPEG